MKPLAILWLAGWALLLALLPGCQQTPGIAKFNPSFLPYIAGYTSGTISTASAIEVELTAAIAEEGQIGESVAKDLISFTPSIAGTAIYADANTIRFQPDENLPGNTLYQATFDLGAVMEVPDSLAAFAFNFKTIQQHIALHIEALVNEPAQQSKEKTLRGTVYTADVVADSVLEQLFTASLEKQPQTIQWTHEGDRKTHHFEIAHLIRTEEPQDLLLIWDGSDIGAQEGEKLVLIPGMRTFSIEKVRVQQEPEQRITLEFSDPLDQEQSLSGLIRLEGQSIQMEQEANLVYLYPTGRAVGSFNVTIDAAVRDISGRSLGKGFAEQVVFQEIKPAVRLVGNGVIVPNTDGLVFPFEAVNLNAVDVTVIKIYENNVLQFLQNNALDEQDQIQRVGRPVAHETIQLEPTNPTDLHQWMRYGIQLEEIIRTEPGAIYHVGLSFRPSYSVFGCGTEAAPEDPKEPMPYMEDNWDNFQQRYYSNWYYYETYFGEDFSWSDRDDPCKAAYYNRDRFVGRNVLASNLGLVAKRSNDGALIVSATDLATTEPISNASIHVYNFQQQSIAHLQTDNRGQAQTKLKGEPFVLVAEKGGEKGYLKLQDGSALSVSRLDVGGVTPKDGLKGFLYAERGVWRPGDSVYLQLMLEDEGNRLPENYPITFQLTNPKGQTVQKTVHTPAVKGHYDLRFATAAEAPTGNWSAQVKAGGATFSKRIKVETIKPNRLKVRLEPDMATIREVGEPVPATLFSQWLHGASAGGLQYDIELQLRPTGNMTFPTYNAFRFLDPANDFYASPQIIAEGRLNAEGEAQLALDLNTERTAPGRLQAAFKTRVYEPSGAFSVDRKSVEYDPFNVYVGIKTPPGDRARGMLLTDTVHKVQLVTVNPKGKPVPNRELEVELYQINFSWWWNQADEQQLASYISRRYVSPMQTATVTTNASGEATWNLQVNYPSWGNYLIRVKDAVGGHTTGKTVFIDWPGWAGRGQRERPGGAAILRFTADKEKYAVGEEMRLTIPSSEGGRAWISLESGQRVVRQFWVDTDAEQTVVDIPATAEMAPNVYAFVTLIQPHQQTQNDVPIRLYGALPLLVEDPDTHLEPILETATTWRPETTASVTVGEANNRSMRYTLAVVDEGLLDLTRFATPDPWAHFYAREALGVRTYDVYDHVLGAFGGTLEQLLSIGGDAELAATAPNKRTNRFTPMVRFLGPFTLAAGQKTTHAVDIPSYVGAVRVMVVAAGEAEAYGKAEQSVQVKKPLMVLATAPRVLSPTEQIEVPVSVFAMEEQVKEAQVTISVSDNLEVIGSASKTVAFAQPGDQLVPFEVKVKEATGDGSLTIEAKSGAEQARQTVNIPIRNPNPVVTAERYQVVQPGETMTANLAPIGIAGTNEALLEVSVIPPLNLSSRLGYLIRYPHGCVEQTTSRIFPQLFLTDLLDLSPEREEQLQRNIKVAVAKLASFQQANGGLSYWPGMNTIDDWSTTYAGHFMLLAKERGYTLPYDFLNGWIDYQSQLATRWTPEQEGSHYGYSSQLIQAYRLYTLALAGKPELGAMNLLREQSNLSNVAAWRLAAAYAYAGQRAAALTMTANLRTQVLTHAYHRTYGSALRDKAIILECMAVLGLKQKAEELATEISNQLMQERWYSTQTTAYSLVALAQYARPEEAGEHAFTYAWQGASTNTATEQLVWQRDLPGAEEAGSFTFENTAFQPLHVTVYQSGQPPLGEVEPRSENIAVQLVYRNRNGDKVDPALVAQGTDLVAEVTVSHSGNRNSTFYNLALTHIVPAGWEITSSRLDDFETQGANDRYDYQDIRDDRVLTYFDLLPRKSKTFRYTVNATYKGTFFHPGISVEAMYDRDVVARQAGQWVQVVQPGEETARK